MSYPTLEIILGIINAAGQPVTTGTAVFTPTGPVAAGDGIAEIFASPVSVQLDSGEPPPASVQLIPTDLPGMAAWAWQVAFTGTQGAPAPFSFQAPAGPASFTVATGTPGQLIWEATDGLTVLPAGTGVRLAGGSLPSELTAGTTYYVVSPSGQGIELAVTPGGSPVALPSAGAGTLTVVSYYLAGLAPVGPSASFSAVMAAPAGTPAAGQVPIATGSGTATAWGTFSGGGGGGDPAGAAATAQANAEAYAAAQASAALSAAETFATSAANTAQSTAETYADTAAGTAQANAETFAASAAGTALSNAETYAAAQGAAAQAASLSLASGGTVAGPVNFTAEVTAPVPVNPADVAVKSYVDGIATGLSVRPAVQEATTAALPPNTYSNGTSGAGATLTATGNGALTVDGNAVAVSDRILILHEAAPANNGIYTVTATGSSSAPYVLTRAADLNTGSQFPGAYVFVLEGTAPPSGNQGTGWVIASAGPFTVGTTAVTWTKFSSVQSPVPVGSGGTGASTQQGALDNIAGAVTSGSYLRGNGTHVVMGAIQAADVPALNQNTTGTAGGLTGTPALPAGTTAATQSPGDSTAKVATGAFVAAAVAAGVTTAETFATSAAGTAQSTAETYAAAQASAAQANAETYAAAQAAAAQAAAQAASLSLASGGTVAGPAHFTAGVTVQTPVNPADAVTKAYADSVATGLSPRQAVTEATTAGLPASTYSNGTSGVGATLTATANGALTIDGIAVAVNDRVLVRAELPAANNGIYTVTATGGSSAPWVLTRAADLNTGSQFPGAYVFVQAGTANAGTGWVVLGAGPFTVGTTAVTWSKFSSQQGTVQISSGGTGATTQQAALNAIAGAVTAGNYPRGNGTNVIMGPIQAADIPVLNQNTTGTAAGLTGTPALPAGTTAVTQSPGDNTTKVATGAFVTAAVAAGVTAAETASLPAPGGTATAGYLPYATGSGSASSWGPPPGGGGGGGGALTPSSIITTGTTTAAGGNLYLFDVTAGNCTLNLPAAPADGTQIGWAVIRNVPGSISTLSSLNTLTVKANNGGSGSDQFGDDNTVQTLILDQLNQGGIWQYAHTAAKWYPVSGGDLTTAAADSRYQRVVNVKGFPFYALGNDSHDDTPNITGAITLATALGVPAYFPPGQYRVSQLTLPQGAVLQGSNAGTYGQASPLTEDAPGYPVCVLKRIAGTNQHLISIPSTDSYQRIYDIAIDGNKQNNTFGFGLHIQDAGSAPSESQVYVERCFFHDNPMSNIYLGYGRRANKVRDCILNYAGNPTVAALTASGGGSGTAQWNALCDGITVNGSDNTISGNIIGSNYRAGITLGTTATVNWNALSLSPFLTKSAAVTHVTGNDMYQNLVGIAIAGGSSDCIIAHNGLDRHTLQAITVHDGYSNTITANSLHSNGGNAAPATPVATIGVASGIAVSHIDIASGVSQVSVHGNNFGPQDGGWATRGKYAVNIAGAASRVLGHIGGIDGSSNPAVTSGITAPGTYGNPATTRVVTKTAAYTAADGDLVLANAAGGPITITSPAALSGAVIRVKKTDSSANTVTFHPAAGTVDGAANSVISTQYAHVTYACDGTSWWIS